MGFTRRETHVLVFLVSSFVIGVTVWAYRNYWEPLPEMEEEGSWFSENGNTSESEDVQTSQSEEGDFTVFLNRATREELEKLPGVGWVTAEHIIAYRDRKGRFRSIAELMEVKGIGPKKFEKMKGHIRLD